MHRARNLYAKLPGRERERVKQAYWRALDDAIGENDAKQRLQALVDELDKDGYTAADGGQQICSSDHSARSRGGPR